jgi:hypothetical protein
VLRLEASWGPQFQCPFLCIRTTSRSYKSFVVGFRVITAGPVVETSLSFQVHNVKLTSCAPCLQPEVVTKLVGFREDIVKADRKEVRSSSGLCDRFGASALSQTLWEAQATCGLAFMFCLSRTCLLRKYIRNDTNDLSLQVIARCQEIFQSSLKDGEAPKPGLIFSRLSAIPRPKLTLKK